MPIFLYFLNFSKKNRIYKQVPKANSLINHFGVDKDYNRYGLPAVLSVSKMTIKGKNNHISNVIMQTHENDQKDCGKSSYYYKFCIAYHSFFYILDC